ncbi:MAG: hypothetical protein Q9217_006620, partial [Psora testacea]
MPSFFFHLAFDLDSVHSDSRATSIPNDHRIYHNGSSRHLPNAETRAPKHIAPEPNGKSIEVPGSTASSSPSYDWRYDRISSQTITMAPSVVSDEHGSKTGGGENITNGIGAGPVGLATKGRFEPCDPQDEDLGWGVVRLYRDAEETRGLYDEPITTKHSKLSRALSKKEDGERPKFQDGDCTTLCILAVPSYLTPSDFLGFVGEKTRDDVSHFRMIRTERGNRYMVLMKFRVGKRAREWRRQWNGKAFDGMEVPISHLWERTNWSIDFLQPENCHVVFIKSIEVRTVLQPDQEASFPDMRNDPFTPSITKTSTPTSSSATSPQSSTLLPTSRSSKPLAPPTPALIELPTCPVCLERMDETTGLLTILCQHVFHCSCLQKWRGSGCPVCRYTQDDISSGKRNQNGTMTANDDLNLNECSVCHLEENLWICLICGNVGCGRYDAAHAFAHFKETSHCFAMDMATQRVWDYASDGYVHRILQNKADGKLVELTPVSVPNHQRNGGDDEFDDCVPREKLDNIGLEYTHLLTSQLDSQRMYFEEVLERAADKASQASATAEKATETSSRFEAQLATLQAKHDSLVNDTMPTLERDRDREARKADKYGEMARRLEKEWRDEKAMNASLMERVALLGTQVDVLKTENADLKEQNRDLMMFLEGQKKLNALELGEAELHGGG